MRRPLGICFAMAFLFVKWQAQFLGKCDLELLLLSSPCPLPPLSVDDDHQVITDRLTTRWVIFWVNACGGAVSSGLLAFSCFIVFG